ncbi:hypothetical protein RU639_001327 [Aspergillus parasiticus]
MRLNLAYVALLAAGTAQQAFCARDFKQTLTDFEALENAAREVGTSVDNYHGGLTGAVDVANKGRAAQQAADNARKNLDADKEPFTDTEARQVMDYYDRTNPIIVDNLHKVTEKAPEFRKAGVGSIAHGMVSHMQDTKEALRVAYQQKLPTEEQRRMASSDDKLDNAFKEASAALSE